jgi:MFS family permease
LFNIGFTNFIINMGISYIVPFYPDLASQEAGLDFTLIGVVLAINSLGSIISSYVFGARIQVWGRKRSLIVSLFISSSVMLLFALLYFITSSYWGFLALSLFIRIIQGMSRSVYAITNFAYLNIFWPDSFA